MKIDELRAIVISLHKLGKTPGNIFREMAKFEVSRNFVYRTIKRYEDTGSTDKRYNGGCRKSATAEKNVSLLKYRIMKDPDRSARKLAADMKISDRSVRRMLHEIQEDSDSDEFLEKIKKKKPQKRETPKKVAEKSKNSDWKTEEIPESSECSSPSDLGVELI